MTRKLTAFDKGADAYHCGRHMNPYSWVSERKSFNEWNRGYHDAKDKFEADEDRVAQIRQEELSKYKPGKIK